MHPDPLVGEGKDARRELVVDPGRQQQLARGGPREVPGLDPGRREKEPSARIRRDRAHDHRRAGAQRDPGRSDRGRRSPSTNARTSSPLMEMAMPMGSEYGFGLLSV